MSFQEFPPALMVLSPRLTKAGDPGSSVVGMNTTPLADGALTYCIENQLAYRLDKQSAAAPDGNLVLAPLYGPGRWLADVAPSPASSLGGVAQCDRFNAGNSWADPGSAGLYVVAGNATGPRWVFSGTGFTLSDALSCVLTYSGPSGRRFLATLTASASVPPGGAGNALCSLAIARNNDLVGAALGDDASAVAGAAYVDLHDDNSQSQMGSQRQLTLTTGDTLRPVGAMSNTTSFGVLTCAFSVVQTDP